jgi:hypothetical protein
LHSLRIQVQAAIVPVLAPATQIAAVDRLSSDLWSQQVVG